MSKSPFHISKNQIILTKDIIRINNIFNLLNNNETINDKIKEIKELQKEELLFNQFIPL